MSKQHDADDPVEFARRAVCAAIEDLEHVREDQEDHQLRRPAVQIPEKESRRYDKLQVLHVGVGLRHGRVVVEHEQNAGDDQDQERPEGQRAQVPCGAEADHALADFGGEQMKEDILLDGESAVQRAMSPYRCGRQIATPGCRALCSTISSVLTGMLISSNTAAAECRWSDRPSGPLHR